MVGSSIHSHRVVMTIARMMSLTDPRGGLKSVEYLINVAHMCMPIEQVFFFYQNPYS